VDSFITLMNRSGQVIARDDDGGGMPDARLEATLPNTDEYVVFVRNQTKTGFGPQYFYRLSLRSLQPGFNVVYRQDGVDNQGRQTQVPVDSIAVQQGSSVEFEVLTNRYEGQGGDIAMTLNPPPNFPKGLSIERITKTPERDKGPNQFKIVVEKDTVMKNGMGSTFMRLKADETMPVGTYLNLYMRFNGVAGAQPFQVNKPLWITVMPK
jgi:hypothetical protein